MMSIPMNPYGTLGVTASMAFSGAQVVAVQISKIAQRMSDISLKMTEQETMDQVKTLYYSALVMEQTVELLHRNLDNMKELYKYTEESVKVGIAEQTDADQLLIQGKIHLMGSYSRAVIFRCVYLMDYLLQLFGNGLQLAAPATWRRCQHRNRADTKHRGFAQCRGRFCFGKRRFRPRQQLQLPVA